MMTKLLTAIVTVALALTALLPRALAADDAATNKACVELFQVRGQTMPYAPAKTCALFVSEQRRQFPGHETEMCIKLSGRFYNYAHGAQTDEQIWMPPPTAIVTRLTTLCGVIFAAQPSAPQQQQDAGKPTGPAPAPDVDNPTGPFPATGAEEGCVMMLTQAASRIDNMGVSRQACRDIRRQLIAQYAKASDRLTACVITAVALYNRGRSRADNDPPAKDVRDRFVIACLMQVHNVSEAKAAEAWRRSQ